jgi:hypothetical protein
LADPNTPGCGIEWTCDPETEVYDANTNTCEPRETPTPEPVDCQAQPNHPDCGGSTVPMKPCPDGSSVPLDKKCPPAQTLPDPFEPGTGAPGLPGPDPTLPDPNCPGGDYPDCLLAPLVPNRESATTEESRPGPGQDPLAPPTEITCPDGTTAATLEDCPEPEPTTQTCDDGSVISIEETCPEPPDTKVCDDGSVVEEDEDCPEIDEGEDLEQSEQQDFASEEMQSFEGLEGEGGDGGDGNTGNQGGIMGDQSESLESDDSGESGGEAE